MKSLKWNHFSSINIIPQIEESLFWVGLNYILNSRLILWFFDSYWFGTGSSQIDRVQTVLRNIEPEIDTGTNQFFNLVYFFDKSLIFEKSNFWRSIFCWTWSFEILNSNKIFKCPKLTLLLKADDPWRLNQSNGKRIVLIRSSAWASHDR